MARYSSILETIGRTPLIKLNKVTQGIDSTFFVKAEFLNPGGSIKDRIGVAMIDAAEKAGLLKPGGTIIEATAGNTGVGLALAAAIKGYRTIFVMPDKMSEDKVNLLKAYGAEVVITPTSVPPDSPESYNGVADRLAGEIPGAFRPSQFSNPYNPLAHYQSTGPEIWEDTEGKIDIFVAGMGTGGTISGIGRFLKEKNPDITIVGADPEGSILSGDAPKSWKVEGIGEDFIPKTFNRQVVDEMVRVSDKESFNMARRLAKEEGLLVGGSSGTALAAALKYAQRLDRPKVIVVLLPDTGRNYLSKVYSDSWIQDNGLWMGEKPKAAKVGDLLVNKLGFPLIISIHSNERLTDAINIMHHHGISQLPVVDDDKIVGSLSESSLMPVFREEVDVASKRVADVMGKPLPILDDGKDLSEAHRLFLSGVPGIVITHQGVPVGVITKMDVINYRVKQKENLSNEA